MPSAFFSYARGDAPIVDRIAKDLKSRGVDTWVDRERIVPGSFWSDAIEKAITGSDFLLYFISKKSLSSQKELNVVFSSQRRSGGTRIIPVLIESLDVSILPSSVAGVQWADFTGDYDKGLGSLLQALQVVEGPSVDQILSSTKFIQMVTEQIEKVLGEKQRSTSQIDPQLVFVITAFSPDLEPIYKKGIKEAANAAGLQAKRVKDVQGDYQITDKIFEMIHAARFVVADLTLERPNVYFELGYARCLKKTVITIVRKGSPIHFDVQNWKYIEYLDSSDVFEALKENFEYELNNQGEP
jgi:hypothetical protein